MLRAIALLVWLVPTVGAWQGQAPRVVREAPERPHPGSRYLFYLHGRIVEDQGANAVSPDYGRYEYSAIVSQLADVLPLFDRSPNLGERQEVRLSTGLRHGFIFRPLDVWLRPAVTWARRDG